MFGVGTGWVSSTTAYPVLFALVAIESAGVPVPGETALTVGGIASARGHLSIGWVIVVGASAAVIGDNLGYAAGRRYGRRIWTWGRFMRRRRERWLDEATDFLDDWGSYAVVAGRWITVARYTVAWLAGVNRMPWRRFFVLNAAGGITWAATISLAAYWIGSVARTGIEAFGAIGFLAVVGAVAGHWYWRRRRRAALARDPGRADARHQTPTKGS